MFIKCEKDGIAHAHTSLSDMLECIGDAQQLDLKFQTRRIAATAPVPAPVGVPASRPVSPAYVPARPVSGGPVGSARVSRGPRDPSGPQLGLVSRLGGSWRDAYLGTRREASSLIGFLQDDTMKSVFMMPAVLTPIDEDEWAAFPQELAYIKGELGPEWGSFDYNTGELNGQPLSGAAFDDDDHPFPPDDDDALPGAILKVKSRIETMAPLLEKIPDGYFATTSIDQPDSDHLTFMRVSRPKNGRYRGAMKVQTLHGDRLEIAWIRWPSGTVSVYNYTIEDCILMLIANHIGAARLFGEKRRRCARCGTGLTDPRSRKLGIGPECEKHWPAYMDAVLLDLAERGESL